MLSLNKSSAISLLLYIAGAIIMAPYLLIISQFAEEYIAPVIVYEKIVDFKRNGNKVTFSVEIIKARQCKIETAIWTARSGNKLYPIVVTDTSSGQPVTGHPYVQQGISRLGPFEANLLNETINADYIQANLYYNCHPGFLTQQEFGTVKLK